MEKVVNKEINLDYSLEEIRKAAINDRKGVLFSHPSIIENIPLEFKELYSEDALNKWVTFANAYFILISQNLDIDAIFALKDIMTIYKEQLSLSNNKKLINKKIN